MEIGIARIRHELRVQRNIALGSDRIRVSGKIISPVCVEAIVADPKITTTGIDAGRTVSDEVVGDYGQHINLVNSSAAWRLIPQDGVVGNQCGIVVADEDAS